MSHPSRACVNGKCGHWLWPSGNFRAYVLNPLHSLNLCYMNTRVVFRWTWWRRWTDISVLSATTEEIVFCEFISIIFAGHTDRIFALSPQAQRQQLQQHHLRMDTQDTCPSPRATSEWIALYMTCSPQHQSWFVALVRHAQQPCWFPFSDEIMFTEWSLYNRHIFPNLSMTYWTWMLKMSWNVGPWCQVIPCIMASLIQDIKWYISGQHSWLFNV